MSSNHYKPNELISLIQSFLENKSTGILTLKAKIPSNQSSRACNFIFRDRNLIFGAAQIPSGLELCHILGKKINPDSIDAALSVAKQRLSDSKSHQELVDLMIKMNVFTQEDVKAFISQAIVLNLEIFLPYSGEYEWQASDKFDLFADEKPSGVNWLNIIQKLEQREQKWQNLMPAISRMDAIPFVLPEQLEKVNNSQVKKHLTHLANGRQNLLDIADKLGKDPYKVAKTYCEWAKSGWVSLKTQADSRELPIVLSVDDSLIVQVAIKRSLEDLCHVVLTNQATEAMNILNQQKVKLLLLDLTMPDIDGLKFCQTIRQMSKFQDLPIVMVTARDGLVNRAKGHFAGTNKYLTKPFKPEELREIVHQYVDQA